MAKRAENGQQIRDDDFVALPHRRAATLPARKNAGDVAEPALQDLDVNPERENIQPADLDPLPPMRRRVGVQISAGETLQADVMRPAEIILGEQFFHEQIAAQSKRRRTKHRDQLGKRFAAASISSASARSIDIRAWQKTCLPASSAEMVTAECM